MLKLIYATKCSNNHMHPQIHSQDSLHFTIILTVLRGASSDSPNPLGAGSGSPAPLGAGSDSPNPLVTGSVSSNPKVAGSVSPDPFVAGFGSPDPKVAGFGSPNPLVAGSGSPDPLVAASSRSISRPWTSSRPTSWVKCLLGAMGIYTFSFSPQWPSTI